MFFFSIQKKKWWGYRFKNISQKAEAGNKIEKNVAKVVDVGTPREVAAIFYEGARLFLQSTHRFPALSSATTRRFLLRSCLPHAIRSSRFGGHCTATGGCSGVVVVDGESIFHDDVASCWKTFLFLPRPPTLSFSPRCVYPCVPRDTWLWDFCFYNAKGSILFKIQTNRYFAGVSTSTSSNFHSLNCTP